MKFFQLIIAGLLACTGLAAQAQSTVAVPINITLNTGCYFDMASTVDFGSQPIGKIEAPLDIGVVCGNAIAFTVRGTTDSVYVAIGSGYYYMHPFLDQARSDILKGNQLGTAFEGIGNSDLQTKRVYLGFTDIPQSYGSPYVKHTGTFAASYTLTLNY